MNICNKLDYFFETLISEKNFSLNSVDAYKRDLMQLFNNNLNIDLTVITENYVVYNLNSFLKLLNKLSPIKKHLLQILKEMN